LNVLHSRLTESGRVQVYAMNGFKIDDGDSQIEDFVVVAMISVEKLNSVLHTVPIQRFLRVRR
jgi:hypothetical protein